MPRALGVGQQSKNTKLSARSAKDPKIHHFWTARSAEDPKIMVFPHKLLKKRITSALEHPQNELSARSAEDPKIHYFRTARSAEEQKIQRFPTKNYKARVESNVGNNYSTRVIIVYA